MKTSLAGGTTSTVQEHRVTVQKRFIQESDTCENREQYINERLNLGKNIVRWIDTRGNELSRRFHGLDEAADFVRDVPTGMPPEKARCAA